MGTVRLAANTMLRTSDGWQQSVAPAARAFVHMPSSARRWVHTINAAKLAVQRVNVVQARHLQIDYCHIGAMLGNGRAHLIQAASQGNDAKVVLQGSGQNFRRE